MYSRIKTLSVQGSLLCICATFGFSQGVLWVIQPILLENTILNITDFNKIMGLGSALFLLGIPFWWLIQREIGHQKVLLCALLMVGVSQGILFIICANLLSSNVNADLFLLSRIIYGMSASTLVPTSQAMIGAVAIDKVAGYSRLSVALSVGRLSAPLVSLLLLFISNSAPAFFSAFSFFLIYAVLHLKELNNTCGRHKVSTGEGFNRIYINNELALILSIALLAQICFGMFQFILAIWLIETLHWRTEQVTQYITYLLIICSFTIILAQLYLLPKCRENPFLLLPIVVIFVSAIYLLTIYPSSMLIGFSFLLIVLWVTLLYPLYLHIAIEAGKNVDKGFTTSLIAVVHIIGYSIGGGVSGYFFEIFEEKIFTIVLAIFVVTSCLFYFVSNKH